MKTYTNVKCIWYIMERASCCWKGSYWTKGSSWL